jgi:WD40 repeat protein
LNTDDSIPLSLASLPPTSSEDISKCKIVEKRLYNSEFFFFIFSTNQYKLTFKYLDGQNCIRWAKFNEGNWLVSAGDSSVLHLYEPFARLDQGDISLENVTSLTGHTMEILHADFSRDGKFLASCSLDNTIIIWNLDELPKASIVLNAGRGGHTDFVTGIAWDPAEKFLASQSADNTLKIWRCETWECERTVKGCFASVSSVYFKKPMSAWCDRLEFKIFIIYTFGLVIRWSVSCFRMCFKFRISNSKSHHSQRVQL